MKPGPLLSTAVEQTFLFHPSKNLILTPPLRNDITRVTVTFAVLNRQNTS